MSVAAVAVGATVVGAGISANASGKAARAGERAAAAAGELSQQQYAQTRADNAGTRQRGEAAGNRLSYLLGLGGTAGGGASNSLLGGELIDLSSGAPRPNMNLYVGNEDYRKAWDAMALQQHAQYGRDFNGNDSQDSIIKGLTSRLQGPLSAEIQGGAAARASDPEFGSLNRRFSQADLDSDVVYNTGREFGLSEGRNAVNNQFARAGSSLSGAALKALTRFGNDYASTKAGDAESRFSRNQDTQFNRLSAVAGTGQTATRDVNNAGANYASNAGNALMAGAATQGAGYIGGANALNSGISGGINAYQNNELMKLIQGGGRANSYGSSIYGKSYGDGIRSSDYSGYDGWGQ